MKWLLCFLAVLAGSALGGLEKYEGFIPPVAEADGPLPAKGVRITYLGTNGYLLQSRDAIILIDPYFSRVGFLRASLGLKTVRRPEFVERWVRETGRIDAVLVTHGHVDHLYDAPQIVRLTGAKLIASPTSVWLARASGVPEPQCQPVLGGVGPLRVRGARIWPVMATHDRILGMVPFEGTLDHLPRRPATVADWKCGEPLAFLIEIGGKRIFINSGSAKDDAPPAGLGPVDLAILGVATRNSRTAYPRALANLRPRFVVPSHQDDFFRPVDRPFEFLAGSDFPAVLRASGEWRSRVRLLRPFQSWMLR